MASNQQQVGSAPEDAWIPFIQSMYPDLLQTTNFFPPLFFNRVPHTVETVAGETALVIEDPQQQSSASSQPSASSQSSTSSQSSASSQSSTSSQSSAASQPSASSQPSTSSQPSASSQPSTSSQPSASSQPSSSQPSSSQPSASQPSSSQPSSSQPSRFIPSQSSSTAGTVFIDVPPSLQVPLIQEFDVRNDKAQNKFLQALRGIKEVMMVISNMIFRKYLDNQNNPQHHINPTNIIISQLPSVTHPSIPPNIVDGECDIIILHRQYGILLGEVKSVGGGQHLSTQSPAVQNQTIAKRVMQAIKQLDNQELALKYLVHDMAGGNIRVTKAPLLPNITSAQLAAAVNSSQQLQVALCRSTGSNDVAQAVSRCLCSDHLQQPEKWWDAVWTTGPDPSMTDTVYVRLVARFCGPASTVDIPTAGRARKVLRTFGEVVNETALRFVSLVLTPQQVFLLNSQPEPQYMYLQGPPGCGKTIVLVLKALQWARQGRQVVVVSESVNTALTILVEEQLVRILEAAAAAPSGGIRRHICNIGDVNQDVSGLVQLLSAGPNTEAFILFDEAPHESDDFIQWLTAVRYRLPSLHVWAASLYRMDNDPRRPPPSWLEIRTVSEALRSPPVITRKVEETISMNGLWIPQYSTPALPLPTEGPPVQQLSHRGQAGHSGDDPWQCALCADTIGHLLTHNIRVGQPGAPQNRDTWVLCYNLPDARDADVFVRRLSGHHGVPVRAVPRPTSESDARDLALALTDQVIVTDLLNVQGMERAVVIALAGWGGDDHLSYSRSTSFLCVIR